MTRADIEKTYNVCNGRIISPGIFEGEMVYVPYFWNMYLEGFADSDRGGVLGFYVVREDRQMFPELKERRAVKLYKRDDGLKKRVCEV